MTPFKSPVVYRGLAFFPCSRKVRIVAAGIADVDYMRCNYFGAQFNKRAPELERKMLHSLGK